MTKQEKIEALISWINQLDEIFLDELLIENTGLTEEQLNN